MSLFRKETEPQPYTVKDKQLICSHCGNDTFKMEEVMIHYRGALTNNFATVFVCANCTQATWFIGDAQDNA